MSTTLESAAPSADQRGRPTVPSWHVVAALARVEGTRLLRHPATVVGLILSTAIAVLLLRLYEPVLHRDVATLSLAATPLAAGVLLAAHLGTSRLQRDETQPLATVTPVSEAQRTVGIVLAALWPAALAVTWVVAALGVQVARGAIGSPQLADALATPAFVLFAGVAGVALGRWLPAAAGPILTLPLLGIGLTQLLQARSVTARLAPWADWFTTEGFIEVWPRAPWVHLVYVLLLSGVVAGAALLRDRRAFPVIALTACCALGTVLASGQLLNVWNDPATLADFERTQREPTTLHNCTDDDGIEVCAPPAYLPWAPKLVAPARSASQLLPASDRPDQLRIELANTWSGSPISSLPLDIRMRILEAGNQRALPNGTILLPPNLRSDRPDSGPFAIALETVRIGMGFGGTKPSTGPVGDGPSGSFDGQVACTVQGQAREVVAFALAASADPAAYRALEGELNERPYGWQGAGDSWWWNNGFWVDVGWAPTTATQWSKSGATNGLRLADHLDDVTVLHDQWDRWQDPATSADELLATFDLDPLPTPQELAEAKGFDAPDEPATNTDSPAAPC